MAHDIESVLREDRVFAPPKSFAENAHVRSLADYEALFARAKDDPDGFWGDVAKELDWFEPWQKVLDWQPPAAKWFVGGKLNLAYNCLDRHLAQRGNKAALVWEGEPEGEGRTLTYHELHRDVCRFANVLTGLGVHAGDRVMIYMPLIPEIAVAMLGCARIGATHSVVFGGFSAESLRDRALDAGANIIITADGGYRRGKVVPLKKNVDDACVHLPDVRHVVVVKRTSSAIDWTEGRDMWWHDLMREAPVHHDAHPVDSEHPLFILYTSGTTGKPKGVVHTTGGYLVGATYTTRMVFDLKENDTYWCTADVGWVTGHSYVLYGPLANGATTVMFEGAPDSPDPGRLWRIVEKLGVTTFYTAPTAIRAFIRWGNEWPKKADLRSLRLLGTVGEPINPEAWMWYQEHIGRGCCPIVDTWWQTETGAIMISPLPGATPTKPGSCTRPLPGVIADVVTRDGDPVADNQGGYLIIRRPWPSMMRTIYGSPERYAQYWNEIPGVYFAGDGARRDSDGYFWVMGRIDDVVNIAGHRLGTMEVESALVSHPDVAEAAVVGRPDDQKGQALVCFVTLKRNVSPDPQRLEALRRHVVHEIGALARPDEIRFTDALPKTRSGKIMRRLLKEIAATGSVKGDVTTLEDLTILSKLSGKDE